MPTFCGSIPYVGKWLTPPIYHRRVPRRVTPHIPLLDNVDAFSNKNREIWRSVGPKRPSLQRHVAQCATT